MKKILNLFLGVNCVFFLFFLQSCVDKDYDWDDMNKEAQIPLPPVFVGSYDKIVIMDLDDFQEIPPIELPGVGVSHAYGYVFEDLFTEDAIDNFFYEGNHVTLSGLIDIQVLGSNSNLSVGIIFKVLDEDMNEIEEIVIPNEANLKYGKDQAIKIEIASEYMKYFKSRSAKHLKANLVIKANSIQLTKADYIEFKNIVMRSKGLQVEL